MFQKIRYRLLVSYLVVLAAILGVFAIAVRIVFAHNQTQQLTARLVALGESAAANVEFEDDHLKMNEDLPARELNTRGQAFQWFDPQGRLVAQQGKAILRLPFSTNGLAQIQSGRPRIQGMTLPILGHGDEKHLLGYVRVSQSLEEFDESLQKLDWGLGGGIVMALALSGIGGVWLTRQAMQPIEESFQRLKQFTADASHELRSPLMAIQSNAAVSLKYPQGMRSEDAESFQAIASATDQMTRLTEDLLFLARTEKLPEQRQERVNLNKVLEFLAHLYTAQAEAKQITLATQLTDEAVYLFGDASQLMRLFTNLMVNALQYTPVGGKVTVQMKQTGQMILVEVHDTGVGIAPENLNRVFDRFWRADKSRSYQEGGSGLGLAIAQAIAQYHGGLITVASEVGRGSCFTVRLPALKQLVS